MAISPTRQPSPLLSFPYESRARAPASPFSPRRTSPRLRSAPSLAVPAAASLFRRQFTVRRFCRPPEQANVATSFAPPSRVRSSPSGRRRIAGAPPPVANPSLPPSCSSAGRRPIRCPPAESEQSVTTRRSATPSRIQNTDPELTSGASPIVKTRAASELPRRPPLSKIQPPPSVSHTGEHIPEFPFISSLRFAPHLSL
jgi:hypothetical protein